MKLSIEMTEAETLAFFQALYKTEGGVAPQPAAAAPAVEKKAESAPVVTEYDLKLVEEGRVLFGDLVSKWLVNFGLEGAEQPDRVEVLRLVSSGPEAKAILWYVASVGGVAHAVDKVIGPKTSPHPLTPQAEEGHRRTVREVATNIVQVASLFFPDLCDLYEHRDIYKEK